MVPPISKYKIVMINWNYYYAVYLKITKMAEIITIFRKFITWRIIIQKSWMSYQIVQQLMNYKFMSFERVAELIFVLFIKVK